MKELPYFKFFPGEWLSGEITACSISAQGIFTNICCYYWNKQGHYPLAIAKQRFSKYETELNQLLENGIIKTDDDGEMIIEFLDEQLTEREALSVKRSIAGSSGGIAKAKQMHGKHVAKRSYIEKEKEEEKKEELDLI